MDSRNLDKAIEIYARLIQGETIAKASRENGALYEDYYGNAEVYEIVGNLLKKLKAENEHCYILESVENQELWGRYTFLGYDPSLELTCVNGNLTITADVAELKKAEEKRKAEEERKHGRLSE